MKYILIIISLLFAFQSEAQNDSTLPVNVEGKIMYREVINVKGPADSLYHRAITWINNTYQNPSDITRVRDRENSRIEGLARLPLLTKNEEGVTDSRGLIEYEFTIDCKDGRYRYTYTGFLHKRSSRFPLERWLDKEDPQYTPEVEVYLGIVNDYILEKIESLKEGMLPKAKVKDEW